MGDLQRVPNSQLEFPWETKAEREYHDKWFADKRANGCKFT